MAYTPISLGSSANDGTGDPLRTALGIVNANFASVDTQLAAKAAASDLTTETTAREDADTALEASLDTKRDANSPDVLLQFPLVDSATALSGTNTYDLPRIPFDFLIEDISLTVTQRTAGSGGTLLLDVSMDQGAANIATGTGLSVSGTGIVDCPVTALDDILVEGLDTTIDITVTDTETGSPVRNGLVLWIRGTWVV